MLTRFYCRPSARYAGAGYRALFLLLLYGLSVSLSAQGRVDSLEARLAGSAGAERLAMLVDLVEALHREDARQAIAYGREAALLLPVDTGAAVVRRLWYWKGYAHYHVGEYDSVLVFAGRLQAGAEAAGDSKGATGAAYLKGIRHIRLGAYQEAQAALVAALEGYESFGDKAGVANALINIGNIHADRGDYAEAFSFYTRSLAIREETGDKTGIAEALNTIGTIYYEQGGYDEALSFYTRSLAIREEMGDNEGIAKALNNIGVLHDVQGDYVEGLSFYTRSLAIREEIGDKVGIASTLNNIGVIHLEQGDYDEALSFYTRSLAIKEEIGNKTGIARTLNNIGNIHLEQGDYDEALSFYTRSLAIREEMGDKEGIVEALHNIGNIHLEQGDYMEALSIYTRSLSIKEELGDKRGSASTFNNIGRIHYKQGDYSEAFSFYTRSLAIGEELGDKAGIAEVLNYIGRLHRAQGQLDDALNYSGRALALADSIGALALARDSHKERTLIFEQLGQFERALNAHRAYKAAHDSLFTSESQSVIAELQQQYKTKEQQQRIQLLQRNRQIQRLWLFGLIGGLLFLASIAFLLYNRYRLKNHAHSALTLAHKDLQQTHAHLETTQQQLIHAEKTASSRAADVLSKNNQLAEQATQLQELNSLKSRFFANISHEFRTPLTLILGQIDNVLPDLNKEKHINRLKSAARNGRQLLQLINQLLDLSKFDARQMTLKAAPANLVPLLRYLSGSFDSLAQQRKIKLQFECSEDDIQVYVDQEKIEKVMHNLLSNALKFTPEGGIVEIAVAVANGSQNGETAHTMDSGEVKIIVRDSGIGIPKDRLPHIFDRFYQVDSSTTREHEGTGIGLALTRELVQLHGGSISAESHEGFGTTFTVLLPMGKAHLKPDQISDSAVSDLGFEMSNVSVSDLADQNISPQEQAETQDQESKVKEIILIVEDNPDMRAYIRETLLTSTEAANYQVMEAPDGEEGFEKAQAAVPDLIITDVMMPGIDGYELTRRLRQDQATSHIPIIMLTAKAAESDKFAGLETGVDVFLIKPFSSKELQIRVRKLIENRKLLLAKVRERPMITASEVMATSANQQFLDRLLQIVEENLSDENFQVESLCREIGLSPAGLYRKLNALLDCTPALYIRRIRLERARQLLEQKAGNVTEIAFQVGYSNTSNFARAFREAFQISPSEFLKKT